MAKKTKNIEYYEAIGRRKTSVARVRLYIVSKDKITNIDGVKIKAGSIFINKKPIEKVFSESYNQDFINLPLKNTKSEHRFAISIFVNGGGKNGQLEAIVHGISRALTLVNEENKTSLKKIGLLTRDPRKKERRKVGTGGKSRRAKQSPKR